MAIHPPRLASGARRAGVPGGILAIVCLALLVTPESVHATGTLREDGLVEMNGEVLFPLGLMDLGSYAYPDWAARIRKSRVNVVWDFQGAYHDVSPRCRAIADSARAGGWSLLIGSDDTIQWDNPETVWFEVDQPIYEDWRLSNLAHCAGEDVILGFTNRDEPVWTLQQGWLGDVDSTHIHDTYRQLHAAWPGTFVAMNFAPLHVTGDFETWRRDLAPFLPATDVVMRHAYPYPAGPGTCSERNVLGWPDCAMDRLVEGADLFLSGINLPGQPLWMIVQAFKGIPEKEARWEAYASIVHGATGIFWAGWTWVHELGNGRDNWPVVERVTREVASLHDFLVGPDVSGALSDTPDVEVRAKRHRSGGEIVVFATTRRGFEGGARVRLPRAAGSVTVVGEGRTLRAENGWVEDTFDGYEAHVYRYRGKESRPGPAPDRPALATVGPARAGELRLRFSLPGRSAIRIALHDVAGRRVALLANGTYEAGDGTVHWRGEALGGGRVPDGVYFARLETRSGGAASAKVLWRR